MPVISMPNGDKVSFPDNMPAKQIRDLIASKFPNETAAMSAQGRIDQAFDAAGEQGMQQPGAGTDMPVTLNIQGMRVKVGANFLDLPPEEQNSTVDEIAQSLGILPPGAGASQQEQGPWQKYQQPNQSQPDQQGPWTKYQQPEKTGGARYDVERLKRALVNADAAGDTEAATALAKTLREQQEAYNRPSLTAREVTLGDRAFDFAKRLGLPAQRMRSDLGAIGAFFDGAGQGLTANFSDEAEARIQAARDPNGNYNQALKGVRGRMDYNRQTNPGAYNFGATIGGLGLGAKLPSFSGKAAAAPWLTRTAIGAGEGAAVGGGMGAAFGAGSGDGVQNRIERAGEGAAFGAGVGGLGGAIMAKLYRPKGANAPKIPTIEELKQRGSQLYDQAFNAGVTTSPGAFRGMTNRLAGEIRRFGFDKDLQPGTAVVLRRIGEALDGPAPNFQELENLRRIAANAAKTDNRSDAAAAHIVIDQIDDFMASPAHFAGGGTAARKAVQEARNYWRTARKAETVDDIFRRAELSASDEATALRNEFRTLAKRRNGLRGFTETEKSAIRGFVAGGKVENLVRVIGKSLGSFYGLGGSFGAGFTVGGSVGGAMAAGASKAIGAGSRTLANRMTVRGAERIRDEILSGAVSRPQLPAPAVRQPLALGGGQGALWSLVAGADQR